MSRSRTRSRTYATLKCPRCGIPDEQNTLIHETDEVRVFVCEGCRMSYGTFQKDVPSQRVQWPSTAVLDTSVPPDEVQLRDRGKIVGRAKILVDTEEGKE